MTIIEVFLMVSILVLMIGSFMIGYVFREKIQIKKHNISISKLQKFYEENKHVSSRVNEEEK